MKIGILLTNLGTPDHPTPKSVRRFLKEFLSDQRVVEIPRAIWYPILYGYILPFRSRSSANLYKKIWQPTGSPLRTYSTQIGERLAEQTGLPVAVGMHYGNPSIPAALEKLRDVDKIIILPLFPQYSATTTASSFDISAAAFKKWRNIPTVYFQHDYAEHFEYINAVAQSIKNYWASTEKPDHLLFSFHGIPKKFVDAGDPYPIRCQLTANLVAEKLHLSNEQWSLAFQSRLGRAEWLKPYTDDMLNSLPKQGVKNLHIACPGFAVDCLETLEEIAIRGKEQFIEAGGTELHYIPALNASDEQINLLKQLILKITPS